MSYPLFNSVLLIIIICELALIYIRQGQKRQLLAGRTILTSAFHSLRVMPWAFWGHDCRHASRIKRQGSQRLPLLPLRFTLKDQLKSTLQALSLKKLHPRLSETEGGFRDDSASYAHFSQKFLRWSLPVRPHEAPLFKVGKKARFRVNLEPLGLSLSRRQAPAFMLGSRKVHLGGPTKAGRRPCRLKSRMTLKPSSFVLYSPMTTRNQVAWGETL